MDISVQDNFEALSRFVQRIFARRILRKPDVTLGLATGSTPVRFYELMVKQYESGLLDFREVVTFNLDEYYPMDPEDPDSFHQYMQERLFDPVNLREENVHVPDGTVEDPQAEGERYERCIRGAGGIDLQLLGIAENGHIGFNEPGSPWESETRPVSLDPHTRERNFEGLDRAPDRAITMGIKTIMHADRIVLMASGEHKADALREALAGPIDREHPASILQLHPRLTVAVDEPAASNLSVAGENTT